MKSYKDLLTSIYETGQNREDRTGVGTRSLFGAFFKHNLWEGFPALTTKKIYFQGVKDELKWFISGSTNVYELPEKIQKWWKPFADEDGDLGPIYGNLWRNYPTNCYGVDQLQSVINSLQNNPYSRRHIINTWHPGLIDQMALPPCHGNIIQFYVANNNYLNCQVYQRSGDLFVGVPINIASYSLLTHIISNIVDMKPGQLSMCFGDLHIYNNHLTQVEEQLEREPTPLPKLELSQKINDIDSIDWDKIHLVDYNPQSAIKAPLNV